MTKTAPEAAVERVRAHEVANLQRVSTSQPLADAEAVRMGDLVMVTTTVEVTYVYEITEEDHGCTDSG